MSNETCSAGHGMCPDESMETRPEDDHKIFYCGDCGNVHPGLGQHCIHGTSIGQECGEGPSPTIISDKPSGSCSACGAPHFITNKAICVNCGGPIKVAAPQPEKVEGLANCRKCGLATQGPWLCWSCKREKSGCLCRGDMPCHGCVQQMEATIRAKDEEIERLNKWAVDYHNEQRKAWLIENKRAESAEAKTAELEEKIIDVELAALAKFNRLEGENERLKARMKDFAGRDSDPAGHKLARYGRTVQRLAQEALTPKETFHPK